jgi:branched-subunit amino acid aminotransferase/4-amino-4-deoxychorismate lyase
MEIMTTAPEENSIKLLSYQRDKVVRTEELTLPFADDVGGTIRGYRIFTACKTHKGKIFRLEDHLDRLYYSASALFMNPPMARAPLREILNDLIERNLQITNHTKEFVVDIIFSGGLSGNTMMQSGKGAHLYVAVRELETPAPELYETGVALATYPHQRMCADVKLLNYVGAILAHQTVVPSKSAYEVLFVSPGDMKTILEGSTFTVFFVQGLHTVVTPPLNGQILDSVTRRVVMEVLSKQDDLAVKEAQINLNTIGTFSEAFLVSTTRNVLPVTRVDDIVIGSGLPGPVTKQVMKLFQNYLDAH